MNKINWRFFNYETGELIDPTASDFTLMPHELVEGAETYDDVLPASINHEIAVLDDHDIIKSSDGEEKYLVWAIGECSPVVEYSRRIAMNTAKSMQFDEPSVAVTVIDVRALKIVEFFPAKTEIYVCPNHEWLRDYLDLSEREEIIEEIVTEFYCKKLIDELEDCGFHAHTDHPYTDFHQWNGAQSRVAIGSVMLFDFIDKFDMKNIFVAMDSAREQTEAFTKERLASIEVIE